MTCGYVDFLDVCRGERTPAARALVLFNSCSTATVELLCKVGAKVKNTITLISYDTTAVSINVT